MPNSVPFSPLLHSEFHLKQNSRLAVFGYPSESSALDPFDRVIERTCISLSAVYDGRLLIQCVIV